MVTKLVSFFQLREGVDPDEFWKYWSDVHTPRMKKAIGKDLKKYIIERVVDTPNEELKGKYYGGATLWVEGDLDNLIAARARMRLVGGEFRAKVKDMWILFTEEKDIEV